MIKDTLENTAVRIEEQNGSVIGSGVLWVNPQDNKYVYIFTAGHVVKDKSIRINILKDNKSIIKDISCDDIRFHNKFGLVEDRYEYDVAIIRIENTECMTSDIYKNIVFGYVKRNKNIIGRGFPENGKDRIFKLSGQFIEGNVCNDVDSSSQRFQININNSVDSGNRDDELSGYSGTGIFLNDGKNNSLVLLGILSHGQGVNAVQGIINCFGTELILDICEENEWDSPEVETLLSENIKPNLVLFSNYTCKCEPYYIHRSQDLEFNESLKINNIWVFGKSGVGKTTLIQRNLIQNNVEYCYCDLSPISISKSEDVLTEVLCTLEDKYEIKRNSKETNLVKQIIQLISKNGFEKTVIVIDELAVNEDELLKQIANDLIKMVTYFNNQSNECELKFVISTISNPSRIIQNKAKACDYFQYVCCDNWSEYSSQLISLICKTLELDVFTLENSIIEKAKHSPRIIKAILKNVYVHKDIRKFAISKVIEMTLKEVVE